MDKHWTEDDFLSRLYAVGRDDGHLDECAACRAEWELWVSRRRQVVAEPEVPVGLLAEQRRRIQERIEQPRPGVWMRWSPALAAMAVGVLLLFAWQAPRWRTAPAVEAPVVAQNTAADAQLMSEIYQTVYETEPQVLPVRALFEGRQ